MPEDRGVRSDPRTLHAAGGADPELGRRWPAPSCAHQADPDRDRVAGVQRASCKSRQMPALGLGTAVHR